MRPQDVASELGRALTGVLRSLDTPNLPEMSSESFRRIQAVYQFIDQTKRRLTSAANSKFYRSPDLWQEMLQSTANAVFEVQSDTEAMATLREIPFRIPSPRRHRFGEPVLHEALIYGDLTVDEALRYFQDTIQSIPLEYLDDEGSFLGRDAADVNESNLNRLTHVVPKNQAIAPVQFDIVDNRLVLIPQPAMVGPGDKANVEAAREELLARSEQIIEQLSSSNCDQRLLENVKDLQGKLTKGGDIIRLGLASIGCSIMTEQFRPELPDAVYAMLKAQTVGVGMYVGQFPEWQRFSEQAASAEFSDADVSAISKAAAAVAIELRAKPPIADPEVPRTLEALNELIRDPAKATKRAAFAVWRSLENLVIKVFGYGAELLDKTVTKSIDKLSTVGANAVVALMSAALAGAILMTPVASHIPASSWIGEASKIVKSQIRRLDQKLSD